MAGRPTEAKMLKHYPTRGLFSHTPVRVVKTNIGSTVAADPAPDEQPAVGVGNAAGEPQLATQEEPAQAKKHAKLNLNDLRYACFASLSSNPPRMNCTICDTPTARDGRRENVGYGRGGCEDEPAGTGAE